MALKKKEVAAGKAGKAKKAQKPAAAAPAKKAAARPSSAAGPIRTYLVTEGVDWQQAREIGEQNRVKLFSKFLSAAKPEEVSFVSMVKEYDSYWFMRGSRDVVFERDIQYRLEVDEIVDQATVAGQVLTPVVEADPAAKVKKGQETPKLKVLYIPAQERCHVQLETAVCINANTGNEEPDFLELLDTASQEIREIDTVVEADRTEGRSVQVNEMNVGLDAAASVYAQRQADAMGDVTRILNEKVDEQRGIVYVGRYNVTYRFERENRMKSVHVGAYTGYVSY